MRKNVLSQILAVRTGVRAYMDATPLLLTLSVLNLIGVVVLLSLSHLAFNFVVMYFNYSYIDSFNFLGPQ